MTMLFINTLKAPFINHMLGSTTKSFSDIVMSGEMVENAIRCGKIEAGENAKRSTPKNKENEVNNLSLYNKNYSKPITLIERLIRMGIVKFDNPPGVENLLPNHADKGVNAIIENAGKRIKKNIAKSLMDNKELEFLEEVKGSEGMSPDINDMSDAATDLESPFERDMCLEGSQDFKDDSDCNLSPDLLRMIIRFGYCWSTIEGDCISYNKKC
ncbi:trans-resveratrol di-O-methyltransferase-like [Gossypium australe]|uniref:Trans-resveratrol di-O-methyltransferase-like n=1 Tax=Gossypium australe TaxID=47621 RepID=A0A5B6WVT0_9ROSI|nr:trans-resveratrol di-O-methyltransferase-like [Gossypium australe]